jgi:lipoate-protein ligase A
LEEEHQRKLAEQVIRASLDSAMDLAADLNKKKKKKGSDDGIYSSKSYVQSSEEEQLPLRKSKGKKSKKKKEMTFAKTKLSDSQLSEEISDTEQSVKPPTEDNRPYKKVKHTFEIQVKELKNIPILDKLIKDISAVETAKLQHSKLG